MNRFIITLVMAIISLAAMASTPNLAVESLFRRADLKKEGYTIITTRGNGNYYRSITAENDKKLQQQAKALVEKDSKRASNVIERCSDGEESIILNIPHNGHMINVGYFWNDEGYMRIFIQSEPEAFQ